MALKEKRLLTSRLAQLLARNVTAVAVLGCVIGAGTIGFVARGYKMESSGGAGTNKKVAGIAEAAPPTARGPARGLRASLWRQPRAARLSLLLGERFSKAGLEVSTLEGTLTIGGVSRPVRILRTQKDDQEEVEAFLAGVSGAYKWSAEVGAQVSGRAASGSDKKLIERIALDSPDQFVLAQLRHATYRVVGQWVVPAGIPDLENYAGPVWDVVRVDESDAAAGKPTGQPHLYYINTSTGLIDKTISQEDGVPIVAELSDWRDQDGERLPYRIRWRVNEQVVMDLIFNRSSHGPRG